MGFTGYPESGSGGQYIARKLVDQTVNNTDVLVDDTALFVPLGAGEVWVFQLGVLWTDAGAGVPSIGFAVPAGASVWSRRKQPDNNAFEVYGLVQTAATAGNLQFQWAQTVADPSDTTILEDSYIIAWKA